MTGGALQEIQVVRDGAEWITQSHVPVDLPGALVTVVVPRGTKGLIVPRFSAESACYNEPDDTSSTWCKIHVVAAKQESPNAPQALKPDDDFAFDSSDGAAESGSSWESHSTERPTVLRAGTYVIKVQASIPEGSVGAFFRLDDWSFSVERFAQP